VSDDEDNLTLGTQVAIVSFLLLYAFLSRWYIYEKLGLDFWWWAVPFGLLVVLLFFLTWLNNLVMKED